MSSRAISIAAVAAMSAQPLCAQEVLSGFDGDLIGTVTIGQSRRGVQTDTASSLTPIEQEELDARQATSLGELIDSVPSVSLVNGNTPQGSAISIRGMGAQSGVYGTDGKVAIVVDGIASGAEEIYRSGSMLSLEPELFKQVNVQRGPAESFRYSSGAMGGTVEMVTKDASDFLEEGDDFAFRQKLGFESNGEGVLSTSILAWAPDDRLEFLGFYGYRDKGEFVDGDGNALDATAFYKPAYLAKLKYKLSDASSVTVSHLYDEIPMYDTPYNVFTPTWGGGSLVDRYVKQAVTYAAYRYSPVGNDLIDLEARLSRRVEGERVTSLDTSSDIYNSDHDTTTVSFRVENTSVFNTGSIAHTLTAGVELSERTRSSTELAGTYAGFNARSAPGGTDDALSVFVSDKMAFNDRLTLTPQIRFEKQTLTSLGNDYAYTTMWGTSVAAVADGAQYKSEAFTGALSARYAVTDAVAVFGAVAYNENLPILDDLRSSTNRSQSEKGRTYELGASFDSDAVFNDEDSLKVKLTGFRTEIWDGTTYSGISEVDMEGLELEASYVHPAFYADLNASKIRGTINGSDTPFNNIPADSIQLTLGKRVLNDQLDLSLEAKHAFAQTRTSATSGGTAPSDGFTLYSIAAAYTPDSGALKGMELRASIENLTDETYRAYLSTRNGAGRTFKLSLVKTF
jgi:hemoglobin/transferrin/lactoferrin receptor protein